MKCFEVENHFLDYLSNELDALHKKEVRLHLEKCALCRKFYTEMEKTEELLNALTDDLTPTALLKKTDHKLFQKKNFNWRIVNIAACFIFIVSVGFFIYSQKKQSTLSLSPVIPSGSRNLTPVSLRGEAVAISSPKVMPSTTQTITMQVGSQVVLPANKTYLIEIIDISSKSVQAVIKTEP